MIGRFLCYIGLHNWVYKDASNWDHDQVEPVCVTITYAWCKRPACGQPTVAINRDRRQFPNLQG